MVLPWPNRLVRALHFLRVPEEAEAWLSLTYPSSHNQKGVARCKQQENPLEVQLCKMTNQ